MFVSRVGEWIAEVAQAAPQAQATPQNWPAAHPTWPWPERVSAEQEWRAFFDAWHDSLGNRPVRNANLIRLARSQGLLPRFLNDPGYSGPAEFRLSVVLRSLVTPWRGYHVAVEGGGRHRLYADSSSAD